jgi:putative membrane protein
MTTTELFWSAWRFDPVAPLACAAVIAGYAAASSKARPEMRAASRLGYLSAAILVLAAALLSPLGTLADGYLFSAHMLQHLLLLLVVPPLALLACPAVARQEPRVGDGEALAPARPSALVPGAWLGGVAAMWLWHAPALCNAATRSVSVHLLQEVSLLGLGTWFFWPILAPKAADRLPPLAAIVYLLTGCLACTLLGVAVTFSPIEICTAYLDPADHLGALPLLRQGWGMTPERDQQIGGLLMWLPACLVYGAGILGILARWYGEAELAPHSPASDEAP